MIAVDKEANTFLYQQVVDFISQMVRAGTLKPGDKLPSLRKLSARLQISIPTVKQAYIELERQGKVTARPQSGFYVRSNLYNRLQLLGGPQRRYTPVNVVCRDLIETVYDGGHMPGVVPLGLSNPVLARPTGKALNRAMRRVMTRTADRSVNYGPMNGYPELRRQIAYRYLDQGVRVEPDQILITNGAQEALALALQSVARPGDVIAVESPTFFGVLELIESMGMLALEVCTCSDEGVWLEALQKAIDTHPIKACLFSTAINNPLGSLMPENAREAMVSLLEHHEIPLIEDDVYSELYFSGSRPRLARSYSKKGLVLTCSSFSKTAAPGYRIGWLMPGNFQDATYRLKRSHSASSSLILQQTLTEWLQTGEHDTHVHHLRKALHCQMERMSGLIAEHFPAETLISCPKGGSVLWLKLPDHIDSVTLFHRALAEGIGIAPGAIFSPGPKFKNYIRLSFGAAWTSELEQAVARLGVLIDRFPLKLASIG